jgi:hypothetical protein
VSVFFLIFFDSLTYISDSKILRGFAIYEQNTGTPHPLAGPTIHKRATGADPLTDDAGYGLWQGSVAVGTPAVTYTGPRCLVILYARLMLDVSRF